MRESADHLQNNVNTCAASDTPLTQPRSPTVRGYVYFIRGGDAIKIGYSVDPIMRLSQLQIGSSHTLELLGAIEGTEKTEGDLHEHFQDIQKLGEWFHADPDLLTFIAHATGKPIVQDDPEPTQPRVELSAEAQATIGRLIGIRVAHGAESAIGYRCSNLAEQIVEMATYERPEWATDERQTLPWLMKRQMQGLERLLRN